MTLNEYISVGSKDSFAYWIEFRLDQLGGIKGGSAFKFGIFELKNKQEKQPNDTYSYSDTHGWRTNLGATAEAAFEQVRSYLIKIANWAEQGNLDAIEAFKDLWPAVKWKIAFHYQNRQVPTIVGVFTTDALAMFVGDTAKQSTELPALLYKKALAKRPDGVGILEFGQKIWEAWERNLPIWEKEPQEVRHVREAFRDNARNLTVKVIEREQGFRIMIHLNAKHLRGCVLSDHATLNEAIANIKKVFPTIKPFPIKQKEEQAPLAIEPIEVSEARHEKAAFRDNARNLRVKVIEHGKEFITMVHLNAKHLDGMVMSIHGTLNEAIANIKTEFPTIRQEGVTVQASAKHLTGHESEYQSERVRSATPNNKPSTHPAINRIYYGPPGTGKTYAMQGLREQYTQQASPVESMLTQCANLKWWEVIAMALYDLGGSAKVPEIKKHRFITAKPSAFLNQKIWGVLALHTVSSSQTVGNKRTGQYPTIFDKDENSIWKLVGEWREICAELIAMVDAYKSNTKGSEIKNYSFVTFHQSYGYEEFVEGLRPVLADESDEAGEVRYEIKAGVFKKLCQRAEANPEQRFALFIDEINRGNISKILGELITLIEPSKRAGEADAVSVTLPYSGEEFSVPNNLDIYGTMNTADRSLALLDTALRRRFEFVELMPDCEVLEGIVVVKDGVNIDIAQMLEAINERIEMLYDREHGIGHAYFLPLKANPSFALLADIFRQKILPLLEEYFFEDWQKIRLVLADNQKTQDAQFILEKDIEVETQRLFGGELENIATKPVYAKQETAFSNPNAYRDIY